MNNDRYGQAVGRDKSKEIASKYTPYEAFLTKLEELDVYTHQSCMQFPKTEKFLLAAEIRSNVNKITEQAIIAFKRKQKSSMLFDMDVSIAVLKRLVRKSFLLGYINARKLQIWSEHFIELGRMLGGWMKHEQLKTGDNSSGGNFNNAGNAGPGALNLNNPASNANSNIGARPAMDKQES